MLWSEVKTIADVDANRTKNTASTARRNIKIQVFSLFLVGLDEDHPCY